MTKPKPKAYRGVQSYLTEEQIRILSKNPNIVEVTARQVHYTQTFKNYFCREYAKGRSSTDILREQGIDPKVLGETRVSSLRTYYSNVKNAFPDRENLALEGKNPKDSPSYEEIRSSLPYSPSQPIPHRLKGKYA